MPVALSCSQGWGFGDPQPRLGPAVVSRTHWGVMAAFSSPTPTPPAPPTRGSAVWAPSSLTAQQLSPWPPEARLCLQQAPSAHPPAISWSITWASAGGVICAESLETLRLRPFSQKVLDSRRQQGLGRRDSGKRTTYLQGRWGWVLESQPFLITAMEPTVIAGLSGACMGGLQQVSPHATFPGSG